MAPQADPVDAAPGQEETPSAPLITAHETTPDRRVFTEEGNTDGWIATDTTVTLNP